MEMSIIENDKEHIVKQKKNGFSSNSDWGDLDIQSLCVSGI